MKKYKCIGLKEGAVKDWSGDFTIGRIYNESRYPTTNHRDELCLVGNDEDTSLGWYVDKDQFEEVS